MPDVHLPYDRPMTPNRPLAWRHGLTQILRIHPPVPVAYDQHSIREAPPHDPQRARRTVLELPTVAGIAEEHPPMLRRKIGYPWTADDLDFVTVGCWGSAVHITDPAFGENGVDTFNLDDAFEAQAKAHPEARIIAAVEMGSSAIYGKYLAHVPGAPRLSADGWDETYVSGDPVHTLGVCGIDPGGPGTENLDFDNPELLVWSDYLNLIACGLYATYITERLQVSVFRVTRTEDTQESIEEVWHPE